MEKNVRVGIRVSSSFHEIDGDAAEAYLVFADMLSEADNSGKMTSKEVKVLTTILRDALAEPDSVDAEYYTEGEMSCRDGRFEIRYTEPEGAGTLGGTWTCISFDESERGVVMISRGGTFRMTVVIERGVRHGCEYIAPGGFSFMLHSLARRVTNTVGEDGGELELGYILESRPGNVNYNKVRVTVRVLDGAGGAICL